MKKNAPRREMFPKEFAVDLNATKAAERCGYSNKCARNAGARLMANANIQAAIRELMEKRQERLEITADKWLRELAIIGFSDIANYIDIDQDTGSIRAKSFDEMPKETSRALETIKEDRMIREDSKGEDSIINSKVTFKMHGKLEALKMIGQHLGFLKDPKIEIPGVEKVLYELSEKFMPKMEKTRSDEPK